MRTTYHLVPAATWAERSAKDTYAPPSLAAEGFVHCTDGEAELLATGDRYYRDDPRPYLALTIDLDAVDARWGYDDPGRIYPHVHGPIPPQAILGARPIERAPDGRFVRFAPGPADA